MKRLKESLGLFLLMMKIGLFTFGGGYAMISLLSRELVSKRNYITDDEFMNVVAVAESTPGPIAINMATYIGYKRAGFLGAALATLGVIIPSFVVVFAISVFFDTFMSYEIVKRAFRGIQVAVVYLILSAGVKMLKKMKKHPLPIIICTSVLICMITLSLLSISFSSIFYILIGGTLGLSLYLVRHITEGKK
ncbi:MAG: chromate transporter [Clostridia bacterium]|nr:chromate transporter [Clostridia bacterium]